MQSTAGISHSSEEEKEHKSLACSKIFHVPSGPRIRQKYALVAPHKYSRTRIKRHQNE